MNYRDPRTFSDAALFEPAGAPDFTAVDLFGCTSLAVAQEHAALVQAKRTLQRMQLAFETELEGLNVLPGDRIGVQAGMVQWGQAARVESALGRTLRLSVALDWSAGGTFAVQLRDPTGEPHRLVGVTAGPTPFELVLPADPPFVLVGAGEAEEATALAFGVVDAEVADWTVAKVTPNGDTVTLECLNYEPAVYDAAAAFTRGVIAEEA